MIAAAKAISTALITPSATLPSIDRPGCSRKSVDLIVGAVMKHTVPISLVLTGNLRQ
jgi:hypothetical protein